MPYPLKPGENVYIDHQIKDGRYSMPTMQAAPDHYTLGYIVSGDRRWISTEAIRSSHAGDCGIAKPYISSQLFNVRCSLWEICVESWNRNLSTYYWYNWRNRAKHSLLKLSPFFKRISANNSRYVWWNARRIHKEFSILTAYPSGYGL